MWISLPDVIAAKVDKVVRILLHILDLNLTLEARAILIGLSDRLEKEPEEFRAVD